MGLEAATYINQLVATNPVGAADPKSQGDDHIRMIKSTLLASFPNVGGAVTATHTVMNAIFGSGITGFAVPANNVDIAAATAGAATTALRSDSKLQLSQAIAPAWTGVHEFTNAIGFRVRGTAPYFEFQESDQSATEQFWSLSANAKTLALAAMSGSGSGASNALAVLRGVGNAISTITLGNATDNPGIVFAGTGAKTHNGDATFNATAVGSSPLTINGITAGQSNIKFNINAVAKGFVGAVGAANQLATGSVAGDLVIRNDGGQAILLSADAGATLVQRMTNALLRNTAPLVEFTGIHNGTATGGASNPAVASGTYSPTFTNVANLSGLTQKGAWNYYRVGNMVHVQGQVDFTPAALVRSAFRVSLPIASNIANQFDATGIMNMTSGTATTNAMVNNGTGTVTGVAATDDVLVDFFEVVNTTAKTALVQFAYRVI